ncbi:MAG: serine hydrolase [Thermoplasmatota archaeon]
MNETVGELSEKKEREIGEFISWWMTEGKVPGMSLILVKNGNIIYSNGFGSRDLKADLPCTVKTIYGIGSITKSFTALGIMKLVEKGELEVEDPIIDYLPLDWDESITIHHLLTHTSGMPSLGVSEVLIARLIDLEERGVPLGDIDDFYLHLNNARDEIAAESGKRFFYFNSGYNLLGQIIEKVSGISYQKFIKKEILEPLSMKRSCFVIDDQKDVMTPYFTREEGPTPTELPVREFSFPAGGLLSPVDELINYLIMNMNDGKFKGKRLLNESLFKELYKEHVERENAMYGYGWSVKDFNDKKLIGHGGSIAVASAYIGFTENIGVVLACNTSPSYSVEAVGKALLNIIENKDWREMPFFARKRRLDMLEGEYETYRRARRARVKADNGLLRVEFIEKLEKQSFILIPKKKTIGDFEFYYLDGEGEKNTIDFDVKDEADIDMYVGRYRLHKK